MTNLTTTQIAALTALVLGTEPKRAASKDEAVKRFLKVAAERGIGARATEILFYGFEPAKQLVAAALAEVSEPAPTQGGAGLARLRRNTDAAALAAQTIAESEAALATAAKAREELRDDEIPAFLRKDRLAAVVEVYPAPAAAEPKPARKARETKKRPEAATVRAKIAETAIIVEVAENPKKPGSKAHARFSLYKAGATVGQFVEACVAAGFPAREALADISWDRRHEFIKVN